jgi:hypothetical protein
MPANKETIHKLLGKIGNDPTLIKDLVSKKDDNERKTALASRGILAHGEHGPTKEELTHEITKMLKPAGGAAGAPTGQRAVEWVTAIATAAAGAAAAACTAE